MKLDRRCDFVDVLTAGPGRSYEVLAQLTFVDGEVLVDDDLAHDPGSPSGP